MNLVTVVIPTWNRPDYLKRCVSSIHAQTFKDYDVVVVDDHSAQEKEYREVIDGFLGKMPLHYIRLPLNRGSQYCRNKGVDFAAGRFVAFVDDDDEWLPGKLERQMAVFESGMPDLGLVYTWADSHDEDGRNIYEYRESYRGRLLEPLLDHCFIPSPSVMCRLDAVIKAGGFDEDFPSCQDWDMWTRIVETGYSYDLVEEVLAIHHKHGEPSIGKSSGSHAGFRVFFDKHGRFYLKRGMHKNLSEKYRGLAWSFYKNAELGPSLKFLVRSIRLWRLNAKAWFRLVQLYGDRVTRKIAVKRTCLTDVPVPIPIKKPVFDGLRFKCGVLSDLMIGGKNVIEPWGVEFADSYSFFSLENGVGYRYEVLEKYEVMFDTGRTVIQTVRMREGLVKFEIKEWLEDPVSIRRSLRLTCLEKTNLMDFVLRFRFKQAYFEEGLIDGKAFNYDNSHVYHQYPVDFAEVMNTQYRISVNIIKKLVPPNMKSVMYLKSADGSWVIHARMLPCIWNKEVIKLCSRFFKTQPISQYLSNIFLKSRKLRESLWYRGESNPYRGRVAQLFSPNAYPIAQMLKGTEILYDIRCRLLNQKSDRRFEYEVI